MRCPVCYTSIPDDSAFCTNCGARVKIEKDTQASPPTPKPQFTYNTPASPQPPVNQQFTQPRIDDAGCLAIFISFISPVVGLALYLIWKEYRPNSAKTCLITALVAFGISVFSGIILFITSLSGAFAGYRDFEYLIQQIFKIFKI